MKTRTWKNIVYNELKIKGIHVCQCWLCGKNLIRGQATVDHVIPKSAGGKNSDSNYRIACDKCNCKKGSKILSRNTKAKRNWNASERGY